MFSQPVCPACQVHAGLLFSKNTTQTSRLRGTATVKTLSQPGTQKPLQQLYPVVRIGTVRPALSSGDALPYGSLRRSPPIKVRQAGSSILLQRRAFTAQLRVVRISRLIGNSDTTACCTGWQVRPASAGIRIGSPGTPRPRQKAPGRTKRRSVKERRFAFLCWSLASQQILGGGYVHRASRRLSRPVSPFEGRFVGGGSCRASAGSAGWPDLFQQPLHHWHPLPSNRRAVSPDSCFQSLTTAKIGVSSAIM